MQRFFAEPQNIDEVTHRIVITGEDVNHIRNVLRMKPGDELWVSDGQKYEYHCTISGIQPEKVELKILYRQEPDYELPSKIWLFQGLAKGEKMDLIIQKAVELGAYAVVPVSMKRCVMKLEKSRVLKKTERWQQIAEGAAKQSRRMLVPKVYPAVSFQEAVKMGQELDIMLAPYELARGMEETRKIIEEIRPGQSVGIYIGPEGGFDESEIDMLLSEGARAVTLGHRILRTETAGMTVLSVLMFYLEGR
ncbi:MAG: 16S rRNA (uracil(1498)-N(3))-methyltransferase [Blautia sp.]|nr:16S rRNA (uracil(1498)-N(3))-methyltransferase [Blautia sp.]